MACEPVPLLTTSEAGRISRNHHHDPNSPHTLGADGEMINMGFLTLYADKIRESG